MRPELPPRPNPDPNILARAQARLLAGVSQLGAEPTEAGDDASASRVSWLGPQADWEAGRREEAPSTERYRFGAVFARGGLGAVRRAEDRKLGRAVAVKELLRFDDRAVQRFVREAAITARLQHPGIVPLYDLGRDDQGRPFLCMKLVEGASLEQRIAGCPDLAARLGLLPHVIAAAEAIAYAHRQGVIHRDLKPANILVGEFGEAVVIDWGLAKDLSQEADLEVDGDDDPATISDLTAAGSLLGTIRYMPPEQARGEQVDARSDIYALGAVLYHVLAGVPPFHDRRAAQLVHDVLGGRPAPLTALAPGVPPALVAIVDKAMSRETGRRYAAAEAFAEDLRRFQAGLLVGAHAYSLAEVGRLWLRRHRAAATIAAASVVALATLGGLAVGRIREARDVAEDQRASAEAAQEFAEQRAREAEAAHAIAARRADDLLLAQARLAVEAEPSQVFPLLAQLGPDPARDGAVRALALATWSGAAAGPAMIGPGDSLIDGINLADGTWLARSSDTLWRWSPGSRVAEKLGEAAMLAVTPDGRAWAQIRGVGREAVDIEIHRLGGDAPARFSAAITKPASFHRWTLRADAGVLWGWSLLGTPSLEIDLQTGEQRALPGPDAPAAVAGLSLQGSRDGRRLAGVRDGRTLVVWDRETGAVDTTRHACTLVPFTADWTHDGGAFVVPCLSEAPDGPRNMGPIVVWRPDAPPRTVEAAWAAPAADAVVFIAHRDGWTTAWAEDVAGRRRWTRDVRTDRSDDFVITPHTSRDGRLVQWSFGQSTDVVDVASGTLVHSQRARLAPALLGDGELLVHDADGHRRMNPREVAWRSQRPAAPEPAKQGLLAPAGGWAIVHDLARTVRLDLTAGAEEVMDSTCAAPTEPRHIAALADDGRALVFAGGGVGCLWGHGRTDIFEVPRHPRNAAAITADRFAVAFADGELREWSQPGLASRVLPVTEHLHDLRYAADGSVLAALDGSGGVTLIDRDGAARVAVEPPTGDGSIVQAALRFAPTGATLAVYRRGDAAVEVVDVAADARSQLTGAAPVEEHGSSLQLRFSPSGRALAVVDGDLLAWSLARPAEPTRIAGVHGRDLAFLDEQTIVVVEMDSRVEILDVVSGTRAPMRAGTGGRVLPQLARTDTGLVLLAGTGEVLRFTDSLPPAGAPLQAWLRGLAGPQDMP